MAKKFDGVIEAVHYKNGQIEAVRVFERRGATFSDRIMVARKELLERLKNGQKFVVGKRKEFMASPFVMAMRLLPRAQTRITMNWNRRLFSNSI